jgi:hypothetical protein
MQYNKRKEKKTMNWNLSLDYWNWRNTKTNLFVILLVCANMFLKHLSDLFPHLSTNLNISSMILKIKSYCMWMACYNTIYISHLASHWKMESLSLYFFHQLLCYLVPKNEDISKIGLTFNFHLKHLYFGSVNINIHRLLNLLKKLNMFFF